MTGLTRVRGGPRRALLCKLRADSSGEYSSTRTAFSTLRERPDGHRRLRSVVVKIVVGDELAAADERHRDREVARQMSVAAQEPSRPVQAPCSKTGNSRKSFWVSTGWFRTCSAGTAARIKGNRANSAGSAIPASIRDSP
ncbi:hypothetical protein LCD36_18880, partial [Saccharopolyspora sp. 6T]|uniref:hypothetical protein n=1 Tax=Saccharopolyspora sp. 6T TaxID=2877238 RepID=UPI001CD3F0E1